MRRHLIATTFTALALALAGATAVSPASAADIVLKAGHSQNADEPMDLGLRMMSEHLEKATGGKATIEIFPNMQLGGEVEMIKQVLTGSLDITSPSNAPLTNFVPELKIFDMPFLFRSEQHMINVLRGPVLGEINNIVAKRGIRLLGVYNVGVRHIMTKEPLESFADLAGRKIRTMQSKYHMAAFNAFGANATPISYAELYSSLQTGVVDGARGREHELLREEVLRSRSALEPARMDHPDRADHHVGEEVREPAGGRAERAARRRAQGGGVGAGPLRVGRPGPAR